MTRSSRKNILLTGAPGCGKSTVIQKALSLIDLPAHGFHTQDIREKNRWMGFMLETLDGKSGILAHRGLNSPYIVAGYGVNLEVMESLAVPSITPGEGSRLIVIDEIGKMECLFNLFKVAVRRALDSPALVLATVPLKSKGFISKIKSRTDVEIIEVTQKNRDGLPGVLRERLGL